MGNVRQFYSLRQLHPRIFPSCWQPSLHCLHHRLMILRRHAPSIACSFFLLVASVPVWAQCPPQPAYPPAPPGSRITTLSPPETSLHQDLRSSAAAQEDERCLDTRPLQRRPLSKEDLRELRRAVREHARNHPVYKTAENRQD